MKICIDSLYISFFMEKIKTIEKLLKICNNKNRTGIQVVQMKNIYSVNIIKNTS